MTDLVKKEVEVTKEANEIAEALVSLVASSKDAVADGFQAGQDIPTIIAANLTNLMTGFDGMDKLTTEAKEKKIAFIRAWNLAGLEIADMFLDNEEVA